MNEFSAIESAGRQYRPDDVIDCLVPHMTPARVSRIERVLAHRLDSLALGVEDLHHSHNGAACIRTAESLGIQDVVAIENREAFPDDPKRSAARSGVTMYADRWVELHRASDAQALGQWASERKMLIVGTSPHAEMTLEDVPVDQPLLVLFGNEKEGLRDSTSTLCDHVFRIPMYGFTESFNISVSAGMILSRLSERIRTRLSAEGRSGDMPKARQRYLFAKWCMATVKRADLILAHHLSE